MRTATATAFLFALALFGSSASAATIDAQFTNTSQIDLTPFSANQMAAAVNFHNNSDTMGASTVLGVAWDDIYIGGSGSNGTTALSANGSSASLTINFETFLNRNGSSAIGGTDGANAAKLVSDYHSISGQPGGNACCDANSMTLTGLTPSTPVFVQMFGNDAGWGADLEIFINGSGTPNETWTTVADGNSATSSIFGFITSTDGSGDLAFVLNGLNVGGPGNPQFAGLGAFFVIEQVPEPSSGLLVLAGVLSLGLVGGRDDRNPVFSPFAESGFTPGTGYGTAHLRDRRSRLCEWSGLGATGGRGFVKDL